MTVTTRRRQSSASDGSPDGRFARVDLVARDTIKPFIASAVVAMWQIRWYGHVAHGISRLYHSVSVSTRFTQPRASGPRCVNRVETSTS